MVYKKRVACPGKGLMVVQFELIKVGCAVAHYYLPIHSLYNTVHNI